MVAATKPTPARTVTTLWTRDLEREHGFEPLVVEGTLPAGLRGTLYRNGPGLFGQFGRRYAHPFEGDGAVTAVRFDGGGALGATRLHDTAGLREERAAGRLLYGTSAPWHRRVRNSLRGRDKNTANTNIMMWQGRLFALMEAALPTEVDPRDLSTIGTTNLDVITGCFSAHPHRVASRRAAYNFGLEYGRRTRLHTYELPDVGPPRHLGAIELAAPPMLHDFIATETHLVFFVSPVHINVPRMLLQVGGFEQLFQWKPAHGTEVICVPIDRPAEPIRFTVEAFYQWHFANAFRRGTALVVDYVRYAGFDSFHTLGEPAARDRGTYHRATIDLEARTLRSEPLADRACEFPTVRRGDEGRAGAVVHAVFDDLGAIGAIDDRGTITSHTLPAGECATEPLVAGEHVLALCHTEDRAYVAVYRAGRLPDGPVAKVWFDHHIPITFHGTFVADA